MSVHELPGHVGDSVADRARRAPERERNILTRQPVALLDQIDRRLAAANDGRLPRGDRLQSERDDLITDAIRAHLDYLDESLGASA